MMNTARLARMMLRRRAFLLRGPLRPGPRPAPWGPSGPVPPGPPGPPAPGTRSGGAPNVPGAATDARPTLARPLAGARPTGVPPTGALPAAPVPAPTDARPDGGPAPASGS